MRRWLFAVLMCAGCGGPTIPAGSVGGGSDGAGVGSGGDAGGGGDTGVEQLPGAPGPWLRDRIESPGPVTFNEVQFHPRDGQGGEWLELHNPLVLDVDLGDWRLSGAVDFTFPRGTRIPAGGFLVVAEDPALLSESGGPADVLGPWQGSLSNLGERIELISNGERRIDSLGYADQAPWPVAPDGAGATLAKRHPDLATDTAEHWTHSGLVGGTPGSDNGLAPTRSSSLVRLVDDSAIWAVDAEGGETPPDWAAPDHDDGAWSLGLAPFRAGGETPEALVRFHFTADNHHALFRGEADGTAMRRVGADGDGDWTTIL